MIDTLDPIEKRIIDRTFVALDFETTGLDFQTDEVIEIGMVAYENGARSHVFSQLVKPSLKIKPNITYITGITNEDCHGQPDIGTVFPKIVDFIGDHWIIAHNADFDLNFLQAEWSKWALYSPQPTMRRILDTLELTRILLPWAPNHRLSTLASLLNAKETPDHRAVTDAGATAHIFNLLIDQALALPVHLLERMLGLVKASSDGVHAFFNAIFNHVKNHPDAYGENMMIQAPDNILGKLKETRPDASPKAVVSDEVGAFFEKSGLLSSYLKSYEPRPPQIDMAKAVCETFNRDEILVAEAGTGVGKSLAYLLPAVRFAENNPAVRFVVATHTKTLQEQLFSKEIPLLQTAYPNTFSAVLLKGRNNYLCKLRFEQLMEQSTDRLSAAQRRELLPLVYWAEQTRTGDIAEHSGFRMTQSGGLWAQVNCDAAHCAGVQCPFWSECYLQRIRKASRTANLVVINHALLFSGLTQPKSLLGAFDSLIIDEAHQIEKVATQYMGSQLNQGLLWDLCHRLYQPRPEKVGLLVLLKHQAEQKPDRFTYPHDLLAQVDEAVQATQDVVRATREFFSLLESVILQKVTHEGATIKYRIRKDADLVELEIPFENLQGAVEQLQTLIDRLLSHLNDRGEHVEEDLDNLKHEFEAMAEHVLQIHQIVTHFHTRNFDEHVYWCEIRNWYSHQEIFLSSVLLDISKPLANHLFDALNRCLLTSATLTVNGKCDYVMNRWGLSLLQSERIVQKVFDSPFNYASQALFLVPVFLPFPKAFGFNQQVAEFLLTLICEHPRGTMVLFTSYAMMRDVYAAVQPILLNQGIHLLGQGIDGSRTSILNVFKEDAKSVLFGTASFWEGVDVPGKALEVLVITKIPFDVPSEPVIQARMEQVESRTGNAFFNYSVPEAVVRFRQGFGRLIRNGSDKGAVIVLDQRIVKSKYGAVFQKALPVRAIQCNNRHQVVQKIRVFFNDGEQH